MSIGPRIWQTRIWVGEEFNQPAEVYAASLDELRSAAAAWLRENLPLAFGNAPPTYEFSRRVNYAYSDGTMTPVFPLGEYATDSPLPEGWYYVPGAFPSVSPQRLDSFDAVVEHFLEQSLIVEKGPDYSSIPFVETDFPLHLIKTVRRERDERRVTDLLHQGWFIIAIEFEGKSEYVTEQIISRRAVFVLGHTDELSVE